MLRSTYPKNSMRFSLREMLAAFIGVSCLLACCSYYGLLGASPIALAIGVVLVKSGHRTKRPWMAGAGIALSFLSFVSSVFSIVGWFFLDVGPIYSQASFPYELKEWARITDTELAEVEVAGLGSFIDSEHVWRMPLTTAELRTVIENYGLTSVAANKVPSSFLRVFPGRWRPSRDAQNRFYSTPGFPADSPGPDGEYYFVMYDSTSQWLFVWYKSNF